MTANSITKSEQLNDFKNLFQQILQKTETTFAKLYSRSVFLQLSGQHKCMPGFVLFSANTEIAVGIPSPILVVNILA